MDKDLLRIVIITTGVIVVVAMVLWSVFKNKKSRRRIRFYDKGNPLDKIDQSLILNTEHDDFDIIPMGSARVDDYQPDPITQASETDSYAETEVDYQAQQAEKFQVPKIIQFSIVACADEGFNGRELAAVFQLVGLEYGSLKIYERVDELRRVDFAVASMVEPGTFPATNLASFNTPGLVFFLQPAEVDNALEVFDDFIQTIDLIAQELNGVKWDDNRQPLTDQTIQQFRQGLAAM